MTTPHTPGPWRLRYGKLFEYDYLLKAGKDTPIAYWSNFKIRTKKESKANARLIAAAPELLEALQNAQMALAGFVDRSGIVQNALDKASAAIAKSTGQSK